MHITKKALKNLIREAIREQFNSETETPKEAYKRFLDLKKKHKRKIQLLKRLGAKKYDEVLELKRDANSYKDFFFLVGPGNYDRSTGRTSPSNDYGLSPSLASDLWHADLGDERSKEIDVLLNELIKLNTRFTRTKSSTEVDQRYGRKGHVIIDNETGEVVASGNDRQGSLGS